MSSLSNVQTHHTNLADLKLALGFQDVVWLSGQVFLFRDFVKSIDACGLEAAFAACPYGDLDDGQRLAFAACFHNPRLREIVAQWWTVYDDERANGNIPPACEFWQARTIPSEGDGDQPSPKAGGYEDITRLAGLVFLRRSFVTAAETCGLETTFAFESAYGDLDNGQRATFAACFHNPRLREIVAQWWKVYDEERSIGRIPVCEFWE